MRSRFTAYALGSTEYLAATWHPSTRPSPLGVGESITWRRLQVVDTVAGRPGDAEGVVEFRASYRGPEGAGLLHERSRFVRLDGRWTYVDGEILD